MLQKHFIKKDTQPSKLGLFVFNLTMLLVVLLSAAATLTILYHTLVFLIASAWGPIFIYAAPTVTLLSAASVVYSRQPVHSLLSLITVFFLTITLYIHAGAEFLAFLFLIVYVGAIAILFLFVIILLQIKDTPATSQRSLKTALLLTAPVIGCVAVGLEDTVLQGFIESFTADLSSAVDATVEAVVYFVNYKFTDIFLFSATLYTQHCFLLIIAAILLLTAILGAIVLAISAADTSSKIK
jgi:NADH-quinone oxidoreductase subunit J